MHWRALDGLRGLSAHVVFISHVVAMEAPNIPGLAALGWAARVAVIVFFVLSGFVIASSIARGRGRYGFDLRHFALRRVARIYPPYLATMLLVGLVCLAAKLGLVPIPDAEAMAAGPAAWTRGLAFLYHGSDALNELDGPLWSLRLEVIAYAVAGLVACAATLRAASSALAGSYLAAALALAVATMAIFAFGLSALSWFALGAAAALFGTGGKFGAAGFVGTMVLIVVGIPVTASGPLQVGAADTAGAMAFQIVLAGFIALWIGALTQERTKGFAGLSLLEPLAGFSYTLYVVHIPLVLAAIALAADREISAPIAIIASLVAIELIAIAVARVFERPDFYFSHLDRLSRAAAGAVRRWRYSG